MKTVAAVLVELGKPLEIADIELPPLREGQVLVEVAYTCVCGTQLLERRGERGEDRFLPHCLGHEGSGTVREVGPGVRKVRPDDSVLLSWMKGSGIDAGGTTYRWNGRSVNAGPIATFARLSVLSENRLTPLPEGVPLREAALVGCAVATGVGAVINTLGAARGSSLAVFGIGGVGACAVAGAALAGCATIVAIDPVPWKLDLARAMGATTTQGGGEVDFAVEACGRPEALRTALSWVRPRGGAVVVIGNAPRGRTVELDPWEFNQGKRLLGTWGGDNDPDRDFLKYCGWIREGRLDLAPLLRDVYRLEAINRAMDELESGRVIRPIVEVRT